VARPLKSRALVAVALFLGFYAIGISLALALLWLPWAQVHYTGSPDLAGGLALLAALYVLWALVPPRLRWVDPGLAIERADEPRLFALIEDVARRTGHAQPKQVYLVGGVNAFAGSRSRWLGLRREPYLGLGLPVFALLPEEQWAAVIGHEFGHHVGGDVRLGPWQYVTRQAIAAALDRIGGSAVLLHLPFYAYGRLFLRITGASSREQELRADALGARLASPDGMAAALVALDRFDDSWVHYWRQVYEPAVEAGFVLPLFEGYARTLEACEPTPPAPHAFDLADTHPPLARRLEALGVAATAAASYARPRCLLERPEEMGRRLLASMLTDPSLIDRLTPVDWEDWGERVLPVVWERELGGRLQTLASVSLADAPSVLADAWWLRLREGLNVFSPEAQRRQLQRWVATWIRLSLQRAGFRLVSAPGVPARLERGELSIEPSRWVDDLAAGRRTREEWVALARQV
jgi:Zn-dependent protease with chaperone function